MEGIFTLPYSEYEVALQLQKKITKANGNSVYIPTSRQQKGIDLLIHNNITNRCVRFQVKSSRSYVHKPKKLKSGKMNDVKFKYALWFNNFIDKYEKGNSDYYILFGLYPVYVTKKNIRSKTAFWKTVILCFSEPEMFEILKMVKTKREKKADKFFGFGFNDENEIFGSRGFETYIDVSKFLLSNKYEEIKNLLEKR